MTAARRLALRLATALALLLAISSLGCASRTVGRTAEGAPIVQIPLSLSNVYLVKANRPILIDTGALGDMHDLTNALEDNGVWPGRISLIIVTHAHADHAGLAAELREISRAPVVLGEGDRELARRGHNDELRPTSLTATLLKPFIPTIFPEIEPDIAVAPGKPLDLRPYGLEGEVIAMPGHTPGSIVVVLPNHVAFVGDMMLGGVAGGALFAHSPGEHYYQADPAENRANIQALLRMGIETFYLGHGGPVSRAAVIRAYGFDAR